MSDTPTYERIAEAAILLRNNGFPDVAKFLLSKEQSVKRKTRKGKRIVMLANVKGKSGRFAIDTEFLMKGGEER